MRKEKRPIKLVPQIVFTDSAFLVLDKPAGLVVQRAKTVQGKTLQDWLEKRGVFGRRNGLVHRLDKETSGLLVVAKNPKALANLQTQFKKRQVFKKYLALVRGRIRPSQGVIRAALARRPASQRKFGVFLGGRPAETNYRVYQNYTYNLKPFTLLELTPITGRTHQIRVHLKYLGHPIVADVQYAGRKTARADRRWCPRLFLHASRLSFRHPETKKRLSFFSPLPLQLKNVLKLMK